MITMDPRLLISGMLHPRLARIGHPRLARIVGIIPIRVPRSHGGFCGPVGWYASARVRVAQAASQASSGDASYGGGHPRWQGGTVASEMDFFSSLLLKAERMPLG